MSRAEILLLAALAFFAGFLASDRGEQIAIEETTTRSIMPATPAQFIDPCGRFQNGPGILERKPGEPVFPIRRDKDAGEA